MAAKEGVAISVCTTGQHRQMLDQVLDLFDIKSDYELSVMRRNQQLASLTSRIIEGVGKVLTQNRPDLVLVQGDTTTAFAAALASFYARIPVGHVEAGLRTYDLSSPFPEEAMRQLIGRIATLHFAPTERNREALLAENVPQSRICVTGNTGIDALFSVLDLVRTKSKVDLLELPEGLRSLLATNRLLLLVTGHRRENFGAAIENICYALRKIAEMFPDTVVVYPVHLNPNVHVPVKRILRNVSNIYLIDPVNYYTFVWLMDRAHLAISDSGGVQEEAPSLRTPVLVTRNNTERPEAVEAGAVRLVGSSPEVIVSAVSELLQNDANYRTMIVERNPYGDGHASERILQLVKSYLNGRVAERG